MHCLEQKIAFIVELITSDKYISIIYQYLQYVSVRYMHISHNLRYHTCLYTSVCVHTYVCVCVYLYVGLPW